MDDDAPSIGDNFVVVLRSPAKSYYIQMVLDSKNPMEVHVDELHEIAILTQANIHPATQVGEETLCFTWSHERVYSSTTCPNYQLAVYNSLTQLYKENDPIYLKSNCFNTTPVQHHQYARREEFFTAILSLGEDSLDRGDVYQHLLDRMAEILDLGTTLLIADIHSFDNSIEVENPVVVASGERVVARVSR